MWAFVSLYVLAHVAAGLIEAQPTSWISRFSTAWAVPNMNNFRSCAALLAPVDQLQ